MASSSRVDILFPSSTDSGGHVSIVLPYSIDATDIRSIKQRIFLHPNVVSRGCVRDIVHVHEPSLKQVTLGDCGFFLRSNSLAHESLDVALASNEDDLQKLSAQRATGIAQRLANSGKFSDSIYLLTKLLERVRNKASIKEVRGILKLVKAQKAYILESDLPDPTLTGVDGQLRYITALLQRVWVYHAEGKIAQAKALLMKAVNTSEPVRDHLSDDDLDTFLRQLVDFRWYKTAKPFADIAIGRGKADISRVDLMRNVAYILEANAPNDSKKEHVAFAIGVHRRMLKLMCDNSVPPGKCDDVTSYMASYARTVLFGKPEKISSRAVKENFDTELMEGLFPNIQFERYDIERKTIRSPLKFWAMFCDVGKPVILKNLIKTQLRNMWHFKRLPKMIGTSVVSVSASADIVPRQWVEDCRNMRVDCDVAAKAKALYFQERITVSDYMERLKRGKNTTRMDYIFGAVKNSRLVKQLRKKIEKFFPIDRFAFQKNDQQDDDSPLFYLGSAGTYTYFHEHSAAANVLLHGLKKWFLLPPGAYHGPGAMDMREWMNRIYLELPIPPLEVIQRPGDTLFIPSGWKHAVVNLKRSVGVAWQIGEDMTLRLPQNIKSIHS